MAAPINPTATAICTEALKMAGTPNPTDPEITRAKDIWLERVKNDIWNRSLADGDTRLKTLQKTDISIGVVGQRKFSVPSDFNEEFSINILDGTHTDTATAGTSTTITFAADEDITEEDAVGAYVLMTAGTSVEGYREITAYNETTKIATVASAWDTNPVNGDTYLVVDNQPSIGEQHQTDLDKITNPTVTGRPDKFSKFEDEIYFNRPFDSKYGIRIRYYAVLNQIDLTEGATTLITKIYRNWQHVLEQGVFVRALKQNDDDNLEAEKVIYEQAIANLILKELPSGGEFEGFELSC